MTYRIPKRRAKPRTHKFSERLGRKDIGSLRERVFDRSHGYCEMRERLMDEIAKKFESGEMTTAHMVKASANIVNGCKLHITLNSMHLAHDHGRGAGGDDTEENTFAGCSFCHTVGDHGYFGAPCPPKPAEAL